MPQVANNGPLSSFALQPRLRYEVKWHIFPHLKIFAHWTWAWTDYAIWLDKNIIRKPRSFHLTHISAYIHMRQNQLTSPVPFSRTNTENQRESILKFPSNCLLQRQCWQYWQCWRSHLHVYFADPATHYFVNINRWIPSSLPCWNLFSLDIMRMSPSFRKKCPWLLTKWISLTFFANADWSMGEVIFSFASSSPPDSKTFYFGRKWFFRNKRNIVVLSLLSGQGLIDGSVFLPLIFGSPQGFTFGGKESSWEKTFLASLDGNPGGAGGDVRSCVRRDSLSYNHIFILLPHVLQWGHYTVTSVQTLQIYVISWNETWKWNDTKDKGQFATIIMFCCDFF